MLVQEKVKQSNAGALFLKFGQFKPNQPFLLLMPSTAGWLYGEVDGYPFF
jgi:hypothetical protein